MAYALGLDFGTSCVRALLLDCESGEELVSCEQGYPSGIDGVIVDAQDGYLARQNPKDYLIALESAVRRCMTESALSPESIIGIGVDATASTILSVDRQMRPLSEDPYFSGNINALAWLWKDHTALNEAEEITRAAERIRPVYLSKIGGFYSPEWFFSKLLFLCRNDRKVFDAAAGFIELADYIPARLCGKRSPSEAVRSICAAGHKALFSREWGGLPDESFLSSLDPGFLGLRDRLYYDALPAGVRAGALCAEWAEKLRIREGVPVSVGAIDAHVGAVGAGIKPGVLVSIMGTSGCDMMLFPSETVARDFKGIIPANSGFKYGPSR
jgi:L-ribulokinase